MFKKIHSIEDVQPHVASKEEIRFLHVGSGLRVGCYLYSDAHTFDIPEAIECRGIAFDAGGRLVSRPLHKFFNLGERAWLSPNALRDRPVAAVFEKLDGSMIATAWVDGALRWRSKKSFNSHVVRMTEDLLSDESGDNIVRFANEVAANGMTAIFEFTSPGARIVVAQDRPLLRLLHVRDNLTGAYVMMDPNHAIHVLIQRFGVPVVPRVMGMDIGALLVSLADMRDAEGYVVQFADGDMVKMKCPWYSRLHRAITFLRERDIATLGLAGELDDVKALLVEAGIDLGPVEEVESRLVCNLNALTAEVRDAVAAGANLGRKDFAIQNRNHHLFGLMMQEFAHGQSDIVDWYRRNRLKSEFGLRLLANETVADAMAT